MMRGRCTALLALVLAVAMHPAAAERIGQIDFTPCTLTGSRHIAAIAAQCAHLSVPEDPARPLGRKIALRLALVHSKAPRAKDDWVTLLAGGPGQSAVDVFPDASQGFEPLHKHHNILLVDQRGTGGSHPLQCPEQDWNDPHAGDPARLRAYAAQCRKQLEADADLSQYTTGRAVDDLEAVRRALGSPPLDLVGVSYGTRVAQEYLRRHPAGVRSMILDSVVPPEQILGAEFARNLDHAVGLIFASCRQDPACSKRFGDPAQTLAQLRRQLAKAPMTAEVADPVTGELGAQTLYPGTLASIVRLYAYSPEFASVLPLVIDEAEHGRPQPLLAQGMYITQRFSDSMAAGMQFSVMCAEDVPLLPAQPEDADTLLGNSLAEGMRAQCQEWPRGAMAADFHTPVNSDKPVLLLEGAWDPVTPPRYAQAVAEHLPNSRLLIADGQGHSVMARGCLPKLAQIFVETLDLKTLPTGCLSNFGPTPAFTRFLGAGP